MYKSLSLELRNGNTTNVRIAIIPFGEVIVSEITSIKGLFLIVTFFVLKFALRGIVKIFLLAS